MKQLINTIFYNGHKIEIYSDYDTDKHICVFNDKYGDILEESFDFIDYDYIDKVKKFLNE